MIQRTSYFSTSNGARWTCRANPSRPEIPAMVNNIDERDIEYQRQPGKA
jgi:hypothetical protein